MQKPSLLKERPLRLEPLEEKQMLSGTALAAVQQDTAYLANAVLRSEPVEFLSGEKDFNGSGMDCIADSPVFTNGSFSLETQIRVDAIRQQSFITKYDSGAGDQSFHFCMLKDGRLQFDVYGNPPGSSYLTFRTTGTPLAVGQWQSVRASFDLEHRQLAIMVDGQDVPGEIIQTGAAITAIHDGSTDVRVAGRRTGGGPGNYADAAFRDMSFYPVASFEEQREEAPLEEILASPKPTAEDVTAAADAAIGQVNAEEDNPEADPFVGPLPTAEAEETETETIAAEDLAQLKLAVTQVLQDMLTAEESESVAQTLADAPDLGGAYLQNGLWKLDLPSLGGTIAIQSWQGHANGKEVKPVTGEEGRQAAIATGVLEEEEATDTTPAFADVFGLPAGVQTGPNGKISAIEKATPALGNVVISVSDARRATWLVSQNGKIGGEGSGWTFGQTGLSLRFTDGPQYVQWIDLERLGGTTGADIVTYDAEWGEHRITVPASGRVAIDATVNALELRPVGHASSWVIGAVNIEAPDVPAPFEDTWMQARGELVGIDLSDTEQAVQSAELTVFSDRPQNTIQAIAYRGAERIAEQMVAEDGSVHFEDAEGITSVLLVQSDPNATLYVTDIAVSGPEGSVPPAAAQLTPMGNPDVGQYGARQWEHGTFNWAQIAENNGVLRNRGGYENHVNGSVFFHTGIAENSQTQYTRYDVYATSGSVSIQDLWYIDGDGLHRVPQEYWTVVGNCLITAPGGPKYLVFQLSGNGTFDMGMSVGDHAADVMPSQEMELRSTVLVVRKVGSAEGFCTVPTTVPSMNEHARAGCTVNMFYQIINDGLGSGPITVRIHVGQTGTAADPVQKEFTGDLSGLTPIGLSADVTLQADDDIATMEVIGPNGQSSLAAKHISVPKLAGTRTREEIEPIILAKARTITIAYWQGRLSDAHSEEEADNVRQKLAALGIGGSSGVEVGSATDAPTAEEKELVAMVVKDFFPDLSWAEGTIAVEEKLEFGKKLEAFLTANGDVLSQRIGNAIVNTIYHPSDSQTETQTPTAFEWTGGYEQESELSFYVSRPLDSPVANYFASHTFIVTNAKYLGDPNATVFSFGHNDSGNLGMVDFCTANEYSAKTHAEDVKSWLALANPESDEARHIDHALIPVESNKIRALAFSVMEDQDYAMFSGVFGVNSNSAAHAIANHYSEVSDPSWRFSPGSGNADKINFGFYVRENGCGSGLYYGKDLDSNPAF